MTVTTGHAASNDSESPEASGTATASISALCLQLGWSMQRLYRAHPVTPRQPSQLPDRLPGLRGLTGLSRVKIDYGAAKTCLGEIASALPQTGLQVSDISDIGTRLDGFEPSTDPTASVSGDELVKKYKEAVLESHLRLVSAITAAGGNLGKAYRLGRALADTCQTQPAGAAFQRSFEPYRLTQLQGDLNDLASALPGHSAKAVVQSLAWWRDAVYLADNSSFGQERRGVMGDVRTDAPALRRPKWVGNRKIATAPPQGDLKSLERALPRQGELWRVVLTGEKKPTDLLTPEHYLVAAQRAVVAGRRIATRTFLAAPKTTLSLFALGTIGLALVLWVISSSQASSGGKLAAFLVAVVGYLGSLARAVVPRLKTAAKAVEQPLWESALDYVCAEAISISPVGQPDAAGWSLLAASPAPMAEAGIPNASSSSVSAVAAGEDGANGKSAGSGGIGSTN
jgi:hypothetical protein